MGEVSAMSPRSTDPPVSAAITGGPPTKLVQATLYCARWRALVAAKIVWYSFSWSPKVMVTPLSETAFVAADALVAPTPSTRLAARPVGSTNAATRRITVRGRRGWDVVGCTALPLCSRAGPPPGRFGGSADPAAVCRRGLEGLVALNGHALDDAVRFAIVADGVVHGRPVVPEAEVAFLPAVADDVLRRCHVLVEEAEEGVALLGRQTLDPLRESWVDEQVPAPGLGVCTHNGVLGGIRLGERDSVPLTPANRLEE